MARIGIQGADHALACALFGQLRPGNRVLFLSPALVAGTQALLDGQYGSLQHWGIDPTVLDPHEAQVITDEGIWDTNRVAECIQTYHPDVVVLQRCRWPILQYHGELEGGTGGSGSGNAQCCRGHFLTFSAIQTFVDTVHASCTQPQEDRDDVDSGNAVLHNDETNQHAGKVPLIIVDNRGGEFVEQAEPGAAGADLVTGSLLGSLGGSIAPSGGYVCGRQELVEKACARFCAPGATLCHCMSCTPCCCVGKAVHG